MSYCRCTLVRRVPNLAFSSAVLILALVLPRLSGSVCLARCESLSSCHAALCAGAFEISSLQDKLLSLPTAVRRPRPSPPGTRQCAVSMWV